MDKCVDTIKQNKCFLSASFPNFKKHLFVDSQPPFCNTLRGHFHLVTALKRGEGVEMSNLGPENSLVESNGSFSESVLASFVHVCRNYI